MKRLLSTLVLICLMIPVVALGGALQGEPDRNYRIVAGVIRNVGAGWYLIDDKDHRPQGISSITAQGNNIRIQFNFVSTRVGTLVVTPDETYIGLGVQCGASVGMDRAIISVSVPFTYTANLNNMSFSETPSYISNQLTGVYHYPYFLVTHAPNDAIPVISNLGGAAAGVPTISWSITQENISQRTMNIQTGAWESMNPSGYVAVQRGFIRINAADIYAPNGNLWIFGVFEVE